MDQVIELRMDATGGGLLPSSGRASASSMVVSAPRQSQTAQNMQLINNEERSRWLSATLNKERDLKERKILAARWLVRFQEEETTIFEAGIREARELYESQLVEQRVTETRQREGAEDLVQNEDRKTDLVKLVTKMAALKIRLRVQDEARDKEVQFREKVKLRREAHNTRVAALEKRQKREREELSATQERIARNAKAIQALQVRFMDEMEKRRCLREFEIESQQLRMRQQKEAEQLREFQLLRIRHIAEFVQAELANMTEMEELTAEQRAKEADLEAEHDVQLLADNEKLERQQARLKALQLKEEQKVSRNVLKQVQKRQSRLLDKQQRQGARVRERMMRSQNQNVLGGSAGTDAIEGSSEHDTSEGGESSSQFTASVMDPSETGGMTEDEADATTRAATDANAAAEAEGQRQNTATNDAAKELTEALEKGRIRVEQQRKHQVGLVDELRRYHAEVRAQKAREHRRKLAELTKDQEDETRAVKTEQASEMTELLETIGHQDLIAAQATSFDKQMDTVVSNRLLGNMLPAHVAEELKAGRTPAPSSFDNVALFFTDIYGFKELANRSQPRQIVALLNRMYVAFDDVIAGFPDLYKVETVMDSYMVCAGLSQGPVQKTLEDRQRDAATAAKCALQLLEAARGIYVGDQEVDAINLRIGIQCGPVLAGVIGTKMPHFCLFSDTVNVASRMCSTSLPLKLQVSEAMAGYLDPSRFLVEERGTISVKGKGEMKTFFVSEREE
ncbi:Nitrogen permease regulator 2 [Geranomyces variabilis]|uniref:Nitrogen permease regulator 2 n=1 Tax=Geranomyces variabilis TaxID=109894 RepID=A0AAD5TPL9_9FUNG|nr:Nitrogen permease regulator 2 [Geranomyces variabilis]